VWAGTTAILLKVTSSSGRCSRGMRRMGARRARESNRSKSNLGRATCFLRRRLMTMRIDYYFEVVKQASTTRGRNPSRTINAVQNHHHGACNKSSESLSGAAAARKASPRLQLSFVRDPAHQGGLCGESEFARVRQLLLSICSEWQGFDDVIYFSPCIHLFLLDAISSLQGGSRRSHKGRRTTVADAPTPSDDQ